MKTNELFIDGHKLPKPLPKQEVYELLDKIKQGDVKARAKLVEHNIRLVLYEVTGRFNTVEYDKKELVSIGNAGLMKAITTFDTSKNVEFSSYAKKCIDNEILMFLRKLKKYENVDSLDRTINHDKDGNELKVEDTLSSDTDIVEEYIDNETHRVIREIVKDLPDRDREIIMLHFGFYNDEIHTEKEIADMLSISQSYVSRLIAKNINRLGKKLEQKGLIELRAEHTVKDKNKTKEGGGIKMARRLQTIYEYFNSYTKEQVNAMLEKLSKEERTLITLRYGEDLNNPVAGKLNKDETNRFYGRLVPTMKTLLSNLNEEKQNILPVESSEKEFIGEQLFSETEVIEMKYDKQVDTESLNAESMTKEDYLKVSELLRTPSFTKTLSGYSPKEAMIASLKLGYIDGKCFSTSAISEFLGIEQQEVIDTTRKVLLAYKERINQIIDGTIQIVTDEPDVTFSSQVETKSK